MTNPAAGSWTALIDDILDGRWTNPETGKKAVVPYDRIVIEESLDGRAADLVSELDLGERFTVVADAATYEALGERVARELKTLGPVDVVILEHPHADMANVESLAVKSPMRMPWSRSAPAPSTISASLSPEGMSGAIACSGQPVR